MTVGLDSRMIRHAIGGSPTAQTSSRVHEISSSDRSTWSALRDLVAPVVQVPAGMWPWRRYRRQSGRSSRLHRWNSSGTTTAVWSLVLVDEMAPTAVLTVGRRRSGVGSGRSGKIGRAHV